MTSSLRNAVGASNVECLPSEVNKFDKYARGMKLPPQIYEEEYAIVTSSTDEFSTTYRFTVQDFAYNDLFPTMYLESTVRVEWKNKGLVKDDKERLRMFLSNTADYYAPKVKFITEPNSTKGEDLSKMAIHPCPVQRAMKYASISLGESTVSSVPVNVVDDLINLYPHWAWDMDMGFAGAGTTNYGASINRALNNGDYVDVTVSEPVILWPWLFGGESSRGLQKVSALPSLNKFVMNLQIAKHPERDNHIIPSFLIGKNLISDIDNNVDVVVDNVKLRIIKYLPNLSLLNLRNETRRLCPFFTSEIFTSPVGTGGIFNVQLELTTVQWERMFLRAYASYDDVITQMVPINKLEAVVETNNIHLPRGLSRERLQMITRKNGYGCLNGNNIALNEISRGAVCIDFNDIALEKNAGIAANTIVNQTWRLKVQASGEVQDYAIDTAYGRVYRENAQHLIVNRLHYGTADTARGGHHAEEALFSATEVIQIMNEFAEQKNPELLEKTKDNAKYLTQGLGNTTDYSLLSSRL